jgi:nucleoside-diphosphate-sugar epimerase
MDTVLVTGAAGFIGSYLCDKFLAEGFRVIWVDNLISGRLENMEKLSSRKTELPYSLRYRLKVVFVEGKVK